MSEPSITEIIRKRYSCRTYEKKSIENELIDAVKTYMDNNNQGLFESKIRFNLVAATEKESVALKNLGTYGFIKNPAGFIIGAMTESQKALEDFGYLFEGIILKATELGLGTCWLGGSFSQSSFSEKINAKNGEKVPAVASMGYMAGKPRYVDSFIRWSAGSANRKAWEKLFFSESWDSPLTKETAGVYATALEMVRLAPSASNRQPWRVIHRSEQKRFDFYLARNKGYYKRNKGLFNMADLQRIDMGIAFSHFHLTAKEQELRGEFIIDIPPDETLPEGCGYSATWSYS